MSGPHAAVMCMFLIVWSGTSLLEIIVTLVCPLHLWDRDWAGRHGTPYYFMFRCAILDDLCTLNGLHVSSHANSSDKNIIKSKTREKSVRRNEDRAIVWGCCQQIHWLFSGVCLALAFCCSHVVTFIVLLKQVKWIHSGFYFLHRLISLQFN